MYLQNQKKHDSTREKRYKRRNVNLWKKERQITIDL